MNELDKIYKFIHKINKLNVDWENSLINISEAASVCAHKLTVIKKIIDYRNEESTQKKKRISSKLLRKKIDKELEILGNQMKINPNANVLYFPGGVGIDGFFQNTHVIQWIITLLDPKLNLIDNLYDNLGTAINCALAIRGAFYSIWDRDQIDIPINITFLLFDKLSALVERTNELCFLIEKEEEIGDRNSRNSSSRTNVKIEDCKKHDLYQRLEQMIKSYKETPRELREINKLVGEIIDTDNRVTIRRYRHLFFQDIQKG